MSVCLSVRLSVCPSVCLSDDNFGKLRRRKFIFAHPIYPQVKFVYEDHRVKVKVTRVKKGPKFRFPQCKLRLIRLESTPCYCYYCGLFINNKMLQLSQRDRAAGCVIVFAKSRTLEMGDNDLRTLGLYGRSIFNHCHIIGLKICRVP